jgi:hypothetical protein
METSIRSLPYPMIIKNAPFFKIFQVSSSFNAKKTCGANDYINVNIYIYNCIYIIIYGHEHDGGDCMIISCDIPMEVLVDKRMLKED